MSFPLNPNNGDKTIQNGIKYTYSSLTNSWRRDYNNVLDTLFVGTVTDSTSPTAGGVITVGGVGIGKNLNVGGDAHVYGSFLVDGALSAGGSVNLNPIAASVSIQPTQGGTVIVYPNSTGTIDNMNIGLTQPGIGRFTTLLATDPTNSLSPTVGGALTVAGGAGIKKDLYVGGKIYASSFQAISNSSTWYYTNTNYSASNGDKLFLDTALNTLTVTLPLLPIAGDSVQFIDYSGTFGSNNMTFAGNGQKIMGLSEPLIVDINHAANFLVYAGTSTGWLIGAVF
jgi:hypothetical protein